jgi:hypothetical protein
LASGSVVAERGGGWLAVTWPPALAVFLTCPLWLGSGDIGDDRTRLTVRLALLYYALALGLMLFLRRLDWEARTSRGRLARCAWTLAWLTYLVHLAAAFHYYHHWSHADAMKRTAEIGGFWGGIFVSHLFTGLWTADVAWWWLRPAAYASRPAAIGGALHSFMLFVVFNATLVYETGFIRWASAVGFGVLGSLVVARWRVVELAEQPRPPAGG